MTICVSREVARWRLVNSWMKWVEHVGSVDEDSIPQKTYVCVYQEKGDERRGGRGEEGHLFAWTQSRLPHIPATETTVFQCLVMHNITPIVIAHIIL